jgi:hypothetical protein
MGRLCNVLAISTLDLRKERDGYISRLILMSKLWIVGTLVNLHEFDGIFIKQGQV